MVADIIKEIYKHISKDQISDAVFEGANIVLYTKDASFFKNDKGLIRQTVSKIKKRIELRPDPSICMNQEPAEKLLKKLKIHLISGIKVIFFDIGEAVDIHCWDYIVFVLDEHVCVFLVVVHNAAMDHLQNRVKNH